MTHRKKFMEQWADRFARQDRKRMLGLFTDEVERREVGAPLTLD
jgi:hypothetical protein